MKCALCGQEIKEGEEVFLYSNVPESANCPIAIGKFYEGKLVIFHTGAVVHCKHWEGK